MRDQLKRIAARLPFSWQQELKRHYFGWQMHRGAFKTQEQEYEVLESMVGPGDWVLDIGANVGHYTARLSELVGVAGRVIAFEPVPATFELLASNVSRLQYLNVTTFNAAASNTSRIVAMSIPKLTSGLNNYYMANLDGPTADLHVLAIPVDGIGIPRNLKLVKIDAEGHEVAVIQGMWSLLERDHPILIVEESSPGIGSLLSSLGYSRERLNGSSNAIYRWTHPI